MSVIELLDDYLNSKTDAITIIRTLSGMFNPDAAVNILVIICQITRIEQGDLTKDDFRKLYMKGSEDAKSNG